MISSNVGFYYLLIAKYEYLNVGDLREKEKTILFVA